MGVLVGVEEAIDEIKKGRMVILIDDEDRENEGDLTMAAEKVTPEAINFMTKYGRGLLCLSMTPDLINALELPMMVNNNESRYGTAFTISIEAAKGVTTGISAYRLRYYHPHSNRRGCYPQRHCFSGTHFSVEGSPWRCFG